MPETLTKPVHKSKPRLEHVDAIRPVKQVGVVSAHCLNFFAPLTSFSAGGALMLLHASREAFLFVSACMLFYANPELRRGEYLAFYKRRAMTILVPYLVWSIIYWAMQLSWPLQSPHVVIHQLLRMIATSYYQLYYLLVIAQFYVLYPLILRMVHACKRHPWILLGAAALVQLTLVSLMHWNVMPWWMKGYWATRWVSSYTLYLVGGCVAAQHMDVFEYWTRTHARTLVIATVISGAAAELWYWQAFDHPRLLGSPPDPFQPIVVAWNVCAILSLNVLGHKMVSERRSARTRQWVKLGSDMSYSVFLAHMVFISILIDFSYQHLSHHVFWLWPCLGALVVAYMGAFGLGYILWHTPLSRAVIGVKRRIRVVPEANG